jgi:dephospho-CoA kinase
LGITGGIATGKSSFTGLLARQMTAKLFDADQCSRELLEGDPGVRELVRRVFGDAVFTPEGAVDRAALREIVFASGEKRLALEGILHPAIRARWFALAEKEKASGGWLAVDIPLLFETGAEQFFDHVIVVACGRSTQMRRLAEIRNLKPDIAEKIIAAQIDLNVKISKANYLVWNEGSLPALGNQATLLAALLKQLHG